MHISSSLLQLRTKDFRLPQSVSQHVLIPARSRQCLPMIVKAQTIGFVEMAENSVLSQVCVRLSLVSGATQKTMPAVSFGE